MVRRWIEQGSDPAALQQLIASALLIEFRAGADEERSRRGRSKASQGRGKTAELDGAHEH